MGASAGGLTEADPVTSGPLDDSRPWLGWAVGLALLAGTAAAVWWAIRTNGEFSYPLDDTYIHLTLARNLADNGVLGVNPGEFASAGSSTVWPLLIAAAVRAIGPVVGIPLALSATTGVITLGLLDRWARRRNLGLDIRISLLAAMVLVVPLLLMVLTGMEHVLQIGLSILLVHLGIQASFRDSSTAAQLLGLGAAALALSATRPEVLFVVAALGILLLVQRRFAAAVAVGVGTLVPFAINAVLNIGQGWPALPASVEAKSLAASSGIARYLPNPEYFFSVLRRPRLLAVLMLVGLVLWLGRGLGDSFDPLARRWAWVASSITLLHLLYSQTGWLYRYEAYLVALCVCAIALGAASIRAHRDELDLAGRTRRVLAIGAVGLLAIALADGVRINLIGLTGMEELTRQQREMARFSALNCPGCRVVAGDIGMVGLYGDSTVTDAWGLANLSVLEAKLDGTYGPAVLEQIAREERAQWAMVYDTEASATDPPPESWTKIGDWEWETNVVVGGRTVSFYVIDPAVETRIREGFADFPVPRGATVHLY